MLVFYCRKFHFTGTDTGAHTSRPYTFNKWFWSWEFEAIWMYHWQIVHGLCGVRTIHAWARPEYTIFSLHLTLFNYYFIIIRRRKYKIDFFHNSFWGEITLNLMQPDVKSELFYFHFTTPKSFLCGLSSNVLWDAKCNYKYGTQRPTTKMELNADTHGHAPNIQYLSVECAVQRRSDIFISHQNMRGHVDTWKLKNKMYKLPARLE